MSDKVTATTHWVWTDKAHEADPKRHRAGETVWGHYAKEAPEEWLTDGLIIDSSEYIADGQADLFDYIEG